MASMRRAHALLLLVAVASVSFSSILVRYAQRDGVPPLTTSFWRLFFATAMLAPFYLRRRMQSHVPVSGRDVGAMAAVGFFLAAHFATWVSSLEYTSVASSAVIVTTESLWVPLGTAFLLRERVAGRFWIGLAASLAGMLVLLNADRGEARFGGSALVGDALALAGAIAASLYFLAGRRLRQRHTLVTYATIVYAWSTGFLFLMAFVRGDRLTGYSGRAYLVLFLFAFFPMILGHTLINYLLKWVPPHFISTAILGEPVVSALLAIVLFGERILPLVFAGGAVIVGGIFWALGRGDGVPGGQEKTV